MAQETRMISRRELLATGAAGLTVAALPSPLLAQAPKRGGTLTLRMWDPPNFDHLLALKNYAPNLGYDYGGRLLTAWLDR